MAERTIQHVFTHGHLFGAVGGGAKGFQDAEPRFGSLTAKFRCLGSVDVDAGACREFERHVGVKATCRDLFDLDQYRAFHGREPPPGWVQAMPADIQVAMQNEAPDIGFLSAPCKGFSGLLPESTSLTDKYQALNALTLRGVFLWLEAFKDNPSSLIFFENVPRILTRGRHFLDQIIGLYQDFGYAAAVTQHDCGELGELAQSRKRCLVVARHKEKVPPFLYEPPKRRLKGVGEVLDRMPLPGDPRAGAMHRMPALQWKTWVRLAFVEAGSDWRSLNKLKVEGGVLADFGIVPDRTWHDGALGVLPWEAPAGTIKAQTDVASGRFSVADPRATSTFEGTGYLGVKAWPESSALITGDARPSKGPFAVADPRVEGHDKSVQLGVGPWEQPAAVIKGDVSVGTGRYAVADPRLEGKPRFNNTFRIVPYGEASPAVAGPGGPAGGHAVADPRATSGRHVNGKFRVTAYDKPANAVIAASTTGNGAFVVADPRPTHGPNAHQNKMRVVDFDASAPTVTTSDRVGSGALSVADPRPAGLNAPGRGAKHVDHYGVVRYDDTTGAVIASSHPWDNGRWSVADPRPTCLQGRGPNEFGNGGHYGVTCWEGPAGAVPAAAKNNNGPWSVADPRNAVVTDEPVFTLPRPEDRLVCVIIALDGTHHRPFTTMELAALQSYIEPEEAFSFHFEGRSDSQHREWIGNMVPRAAAKAMAEVAGRTLLMAKAGETFALSSDPIWVRPQGALEIALSVDIPELPL